MKHVRLIFILFLIAPSACKDIGSNPWDGWTQRHVGKAIFAIPQEMRSVEADGRPWGLAEYWCEPDSDMSIRVQLFYAPGLDTSLSFPPIDRATNRGSILMNGNAAQRFTFLNTLPVWTKTEAIWVPKVHDDGNQVLLIVVQYGKPAEQLADAIIRSLWVE